MAQTASKPLLKEDLSCGLSFRAPEDQKVLQKIEQVLPPEQLATLARETGAIKRQRQITPSSLLGAFCLQALHGSCSLRVAAMFTGILAGCQLTKQALAKRINQSSDLLISGLRCQRPIPGRDPG